MNFTVKEELFNKTNEYFKDNRNELIGLSWLGMIQSLVMAAACLLLIYKVVRKINEAKFHWLMISLLLTDLSVLFLSFVLGLIFVHKTTIAGE